jgi:hypothetical protein
VLFELDRLFRQLDRLDGHAVHVILRVLDLVGVEMVFQLIVKL